MKPASKALGGLSALAGAIAGLLYYGAYSRNSQLFAPSVYRGAGRRRSIALTFDDGPNPQTLDLLDFLAAEQIHATFFQCGVNAQRHPEITRAVHAAGHEIGNHTWSHARLCPRPSWQLNLRSPGNIYTELASTQALLTSLTGHSPTLFRAPYGMRWVGLRAAQHRLGLLGVLWTAIGHDWEWPAERIAAHVLRHATPGGILCLHDGRDIQQNVNLSEMFAALKILVPALRDQGYTFETVTQILSPHAQPSGVPQARGA